MYTVSKTNQRILIIDDDKTILQILTKTFQKEGYNVDTAETGREALGKLETKTYDAALIDVKLQDMNGLDLLDETQRIAPNMKKFVLTGYPSEEDRVRALKQGADEYLAKPIKFEKLIEIIESRLRTSESQPQP